MCTFKKRKSSPGLRSGTIPYHYVTQVSPRSMRAAPGAGAGGAGSAGAPSGSSHTQPCRTTQQYFIPAPLGQLLRLELE
jgi:hypothetical protein